VPVLHEEMRRMMTSLQLQPTKQKQKDRQQARQGYMEEAGANSQTETERAARHH
jgi:hypothetical protein